MEPPRDQRIGSMIGLLEAVSDYENSANALGYTVYYYLTNMEQIIQSPIPYRCALFRFQFSSMFFTGMISGRSVKR